MKFTPLKDTLIVEWKKESQTKAGIHVIDRDTPHVIKVSVKEVGPEVQCIAPGDKVYCQHWSLTLIHDDFYLLHEYGAIAKHNE